MIANALGSDCRPSRFVGRVGALAVALGVGAAIVGFPAAAGADDGTSDRGAGRSAESTGQRSAGAGSAGREVAARAADRRSATGDRASAPATDSDAPAGRAVAPGSHSVGAQASGDTAENNTSPKRDAGQVSSSTPSADVPSAFGGSGSAAVDGLALPTLPGQSAQTDPAGAAGSVATAVPQPTATVAPAVAVAAPAVLTAADGNALLGADGGGTPLLAPLAWAALAAARKEDLGPATPAATVAAAAETVDAGLGAQIDATGLSVTSGPVGTVLTISGSNLGTTSAVKFGCSTSTCDWGIDGTIIGTPSKTQVQVTVPEGAPTGNVQVIATYASLPSNAISKQVFTVTGVVPSITDFTPTAGGLGSEVTITGGNFAGATFVNFGAGSATALSVNQAGTEITVAVPDNATTGRIVVGLPTGGAVSATDFTIPLAPLPALSTCTDGGGGYCAIVAEARVLGINALSAAVGKLLPSAGPAGKCTSSGCPVQGDLGTPSVANTIGEYAFNIVYSLSGSKTTDAAIGQTVVDLATQPNVLNFISQTVAGNKLLAQLPPAVAITVGDAVATFVANSFGNLAVATAFAPFLRDLNLPTSTNLPFVAGLKTDPLKTILDRFTPAQQKKGETDLQNLFFGNADVQSLLGQAFADSVGDLVGSTAITGYLGQVAAAAILGADNPGTPALAATIGSAVGQLFTAVGGVVATDAGAAFDTLLAQPALDGQPAVAATLSDVVVNAVVGALGGTAPFPLPDGLLKALGPGAGVAVTGFVNALLSDTDVDTALGTFVNQVTTGALADPGIQQVVSQTVAGAVTGFIGDGPLGQAVGAQVGAAAAALVGNPAVSGALATLVNSVFGGSLGATGVEPALADAAGALVSAVLGGTPLNTALSDALTALGANPDVDAAVGPVVTAAVAAFLGDASVWSAVDTAASSLVTGLIGSPTVQQALGTEVATAVSTLLGGGDLGTAVGATVGAAVVALVTNPTVSSALVDLVDTVVGDFIGGTGVITALSDAAGQLATAAVEGNLSTVEPAVVAALRANADIKAALQSSVGAAVTQFLGGSGIGPVVDAGIASLVTDLLADPTVPPALADRVASEVNSFLGFGPISVVGTDVGAAVVALLTTPVISGALVDVVDTVFTDFFSADGVVEAFAGAASNIALAVLTGDPIDAALKAAGAALRVNPDVDAGVQVSVGAAVAQFLGNAEVWSTVDAGITALATQLITDPVVAQAINDRVADEVSTLLGGGDLGDVVGAQVAATVVGLLTNPVVGGALLEVVDTVFSDLFGAPGVAAAFGEAAGDLALAALTLSGADFTAAVTGIVAGLRVNPAIDAGVQVSVVDAVAQFLGDTAVWTVVDGSVADLVGELLADTAVQQALTTRVTDEVSTVLGGGDLGQVVGAQVAAVVVGLLTNPVVTGALVDVVDTAGTDFLGTAGVVDALSGAAGDIGLAVLTGESVSAAVNDALSALEADPAIQAGVQTTIADALAVIDTQVLSNATFQQDLGTSITGLINEVAADQVVQTYVTDRYGSAVGGLLADTAVVGDVASAVGSAVTELLGYAGVSTALTGAADQFVDAVLAGTDTATAAREALASIQTAPAVVAAVNAVIPPTLNGLFDTADVRQAIGVVAQQVTVALLERPRFHIAFIDRMIGQVAKGTVEDFLTRTSGQKLIDDTAVAVLLGMPVSDTTGFVVDEILRRPELQIALGFSIGAGIGSLFGDNIIGEVIGWVSGFPATVGVGIAAAVIGVYEWIIGLWRDVFTGLTQPAQSRAVRYPEAMTA